jgi:hypothetical protein
MAQELAYVVVSLTTGTDIRGVLREDTPDFMVLTAAAVAGEVNGQLVWKDLPGEVVIPAPRIDYYQRGIPPALIGLGGS